MQVPAILRVDRKGIFALAAKELKLTIEAESTVQIDGDTFITKIKIGNVLAKESYENQTKEFAGSLARTKKQSIQNAYHAALSYLENKKMIVIDDYNASHVAQLKQDVLYSSTWSMLFKDKVAKLKNTIQAKDMAIRGFLNLFDSACQEASLISPESSVAKKPQCSRTTTASILDGLSEALLNIRARLLSLLEDESSSQDTA